VPHPGAIYLTRQTVRLVVSVSASAAEVLGVGGEVDLDGDGIIDPATERALLDKGTDGTYSADFGPLTGPSSFRTVHVIAVDVNGLTREAELSIDVTHPTNEAPTLTVPGSQTAFEDVDKAIAGIMVDDPDGGNLTVTLAVSSGTLALGTTSSLTVTGNDTNSVTLNGSIADLNVALASLVYRGNLNYSGGDTLQIAASDGSLSTNDSVVIAVISATQQTSDLKTQVTALRTSRVLTKRQANKLLDHLKLKGNTRDPGKVQKLLTGIANLGNKGVLTQAQQDALVGPANILLLSVTQQ
jgi:hypothetical protein